MFWILVSVLAVLVLAGLRIANEWERAPILRLGRFKGFKGPGLFWVIPFFDVIPFKIDLRLRAIEFKTEEETLTKDNVPVKLGAVMYMKPTSEDEKNLTKMVLNIKDFQEASGFVGQTTLRETIGEHTLDELLSEREKIGIQVKKTIDQKTETWGISITSVEVREIEIPETMKRAMARVAEAEREKKATIIQAEGEVKASSDLAKAAKVMSASNGALHLRTLQTISDVSPDQSNTIIFPIPMDIFEALRGYKKGKK